MIRLRIVVAAGVTVGLAIGTAGLGHAQSYPERPIKLVVPFPAGGATDTSARLGTIGAKQVAAAAPDGYTLMMGSVGTFGSHPVLYKLDYDPMKAFAPVATAVVSMFQTNSTAIVCERRFGWSLLRASAVQSLSGVAWAT